MTIPRRRNIWDVVVIGGGIGGLTAAWQVAARGMSVAIIESDISFGGQVATVNELDDWPAVQVTSGAELAAQLASNLPHASGVFHERVDQVAADGELWKITTDSRNLRARSVIVATGGKLKALDVPGADAFVGKGISHCAYCDGPLFRSEDVVVIGGGDSAMQQAFVLSKTCKSVTIVVRSSTLSARRMHVDRACTAANIRILWDTKVEKILGGDGIKAVALRDVKTGAESEVPCVGLFPFLGVEPQTAFLDAGLKRDGSGHLLTDGDYATSAPRIYAIGAVRAGFPGDLTAAVGEATSVAISIGKDLS